MQVMLARLGKNVINWFIAEDGSIDIAKCYISYIKLTLLELLQCCMG